MSPLTFTSLHHCLGMKTAYTKASPKHSCRSRVNKHFISLGTNKRAKTQTWTAVSKDIDRIKLRRWRKRGFYSESVLVKLLQKKGYNAVRVPVSNPSLNPLPDIMARKGKHTYAFEVKNVSFYAYFPKPQIDKLFRFLDEFIPTDNEYKHAVIAAHMGKRWLFKEISWTDWQKDKIPEKVRILKRDRGNLNVDKSYQETAEQPLS